MKTSLTLIKPIKRDIGVLPITKAPTRFAIRTRDEIRIILFDEVVCCIADGNYTMIYLMDGSKCMISRTLKYVESILYPPGFIRIHASYLVNVSCIKRIVKSHSYRVELPFNLLLDVSRSKQKHLLHRIESICA